MVTAIMKLRRTLLGRKAMANLDKYSKSRGITLLTKVHVVKAMAFPIGMDVRVGPQRRLSTQEWMLSNCGAEENS